jgi:membrane protease YdiL (CAAX protease family)
MVGAAFGAALVALAVAARGPRDGGSHPVIPSAAVGILVGIVLVAIAVAGPAIGGVATFPGVGRPAAPFAPWALITLVVAAGEEGVLRGALFDLIERAGGVAAAIALTTLAFALMHVPLYGWHVVPLDLAVGLVLAGLRLWTGALVAPIVAHVVADLATWWL